MRLTPEQQELQPPKNVPPTSQQPAQKQLSRKHRRRHCVSPQLAQFARPFWPLKFIFLMVARIGEATNPGPLTIGTANPTGVFGKAHLFQDLPAGADDCIWGMSETHLTKPGLDKFRFELKMQCPNWRFVPGSPAPPLSSAPGTIGGKPLELEPSPNAQCARSTMFGRMKTGLLDVCRPPQSSSSKTG